jgi:hypothetical protein
MAYWHGYPKSATEALKKRIDADNKLAVNQRINDFKTVMATPEGRRVICDILGMTGMFHEKEATARSIGLQVMHYLWDNLADEYLLMHDEMVRSERAFALRVAELQKKEPH